MELNAKLNREKEENKNINKKNNKESDAKNKILILGILILIVSGLFFSIGLNANNMDYAEPCFVLIHKVFCRKQLICRPKTGFYGAIKQQILGK